MLYTYNIHVKGNFPHLDVYLCHLTGAVVGIAEMRGCVHVRPPVLGGPEIIGLVVKISLSLAAENLVVIKAFRSRPVNCSVVEVVAEIDRDFG